ncbi:MAG: LysR family transcriptional regulator [Bdellovibrionaceae bacterium]|nr:LysR family transcriptional regulator [Pseudobdellovibrionaceae bacterium]
MSFPPMNELQAFQKVATTLSFKKASDELNMAPSTLSHSVRSLEERLSTSLFQRTTRSVSLTDSGQKLFVELDAIFRQLDQALTMSDRCDQPSGRVRISTNETAAPMLVNIFDSSFYAEFPGIDIEIIVDNRFTDIVADGFDAGVRLRDVIPKDMVAIPIVKDFQFITVASPGYLNQHGRPRTPSDLKKHNCIGFRFESRRLYQWEFAQKGKRVAINVAGSMTTNNPRLMVDAAKKGIGIAYVAESLVTAELASNELVRVLSRWQKPWPELHMYFPRNRHLPPALRICVDRIKQKRQK